MESSKLRHEANTDTIASEEDSPLLWEHNPSLFRLKTLDCLPADTDCQTETKDRPEGHEPIHSADMDSISRNSISVSDVTDVSTIQPLRRYSEDNTRFPQCAASSFTVSVETCGEILLTDQDSGSLRNQKSAPDDFEAGQHDQHKRQPLRIEQPIFLLWIDFFVSIMIGLEVLRYYSAKNNGIATVPQDYYYYLWRFGPSFFIGIMAAFWGQEEYRIKQMTPWMELKNGKSELGKSLELNYITTSTIEAIYASLRAKHFPVTCIITASWFFRALAIVSTGLLSLQYPHLDRDSTINLLDRFDFNKSNGIPPTRAGSRYWAIHQSKSLYTAGTTSEFATQSFVPVDGESDSTLSFPADIFTARLKDCEPIHWQYSDFFNFSSTSCADNEPFHYTIDVDTSHCHLRSFKIGIDCTYHGPWERIQKVDCHRPDLAENITHLFILRTMASSGLKPSSWNLTAIICEPEYYYYQGWVSSSAGSLGVHRATTALNFTDTHRLPREFADRITTEIVNLTSYPYGQYGLNYSIGTKVSNPTSQQFGLSFDSEVIIRDGFFALMNMTATDDDLKNMNDPKILEALSVKTFQDLAIQLAKATRTFPQKDTTYGNLTGPVPRLCVQSLSAHLIETLLAILVTISFIMSTAPQPVSTDRPATLALHALKLSQKHYLEQNQSRFWQPRPAGSFFRAIALVIPLLLITAIETLLQYSTRNNGLAYVSPDNFMKYLWIYVPSLGMAVVGLLFYMLDNSARQLDQFQELCHKQPAVDVILRDPPGTHTIPLIVESFKNKRLGLFGILIASLAASLLTVTTSGLYDTVPVSVNQDLPLELQYWFNQGSPTRDYCLGGTGFADCVTVPDLIAFENISYPHWTHEEFAFPRFTASYQHQGNNSSSGLRLRARVPAIRAQMNCTLDNFFKRLDPREKDLMKDDFLIHLPASCGLDNRTLEKGGNSSWNTMVFNKSNHFFANEAGATAILQGLDGKYIFGLGSVKNSGIENTTLICCEPYSEVLFVNVTFAVPEYIIDDSDLLYPDEDSSKNTRPIDLIDLLWVFYDASMSKFYGDNISTTDISPFFQKIIYSRGGTPVDELVRPENVPRLIQKMNRQFQIIMAQYNHAQFGPLPANYADLPEARFRLQQSPISSRILEGLLAFMVVCAGISFLLGGGTKVLREDPGSIGAKMRLFVGSEMIKRFPEGAGNWDEKDLLKSRIFEGAVFRLGWWVGGDYVGGEGNWGEGEGEEDGSESLKGGRFGIDVVDKKVE
ncbi:hypothetical protein HDK90DRAFT_467330 [Phyllosticta capitalensis]|uniref:Uncharacterized protein n=1 Tax=Phyllosticta capitalensis TaxID=121624 RepID=A0ABR1YK01_9PEZI